MMDSYVYVIMALLPLSALMLVIQTSPYQALVIRGILGAVAALVYAMLGGADVALTEALVGTMLSITLFAVAVRSSLVMRLGVVAEAESDPDSRLQPLLLPLRAVLNRHHLRLELVSYPDVEALQEALRDKAVHGTWALGPVPLESAQEPAARLLSAAEPAPTAALDESQLTRVEPLSRSGALSCQLTLRVPRLYEILTQELPPVVAQLQELNCDGPLTISAPPLIVMEETP